ncbi:hypothetical protein [Nocardioides salarius]|uniref:hypothetical protein n=1 Tax=Nocardioides salarius TaxID=374513 RepID=UPI0030F5E757
MRASRWRAPARAFLALPALALVSTVLAACGGGTVDPQPEVSAVPATSADSPSGAVPADGDVGDLAGGRTTEEPGFDSTRLSLEASVDLGRTHVLNSTAGLFASGTGGVHRVELDEGRVALIGEVVDSGHALGGYFHPDAVVDGVLFYSYHETSSGLGGSYSLALTPGAEPVPLELPDDVVRAAPVDGASHPVSLDRAGGRALAATPDGREFQVVEVLADGTLSAPVARSNRPSDVGTVATTTYHLGVAAGDWWFYLRESDSAGDALGLFRLDLESEQVTRVELADPWTTGHGLHDLGAAGAAVAWGTEVTWFPLQGEPVELVTMLGEVYPDAGRTIIESVQAHGDDVLVSGYGTHELFRGDGTSSVLLSGSCGLLPVEEVDPSLECHGGGGFFSPLGDLWVHSFDSFVRLVRPST